VNIFESMTIQEWEAVVETELLDFIETKLKNIIIYKWHSKPTEITREHMFSRNEELRNLKTIN
jgi:hypothetical protein